MRTEGGEILLRTGVLGEPRHPDLVLRGHRADAGLRRLGQRADAVSASSWCWASWVDDAIIVGEIYRHQEEHGDGMRGSSASEG